MKVNICQFNYLTASAEANASMHSEVLDKSTDDVLNIFSELSLSGSPLFNNNLYRDIYVECSKLGDKLCQTGKSFIVGTPARGEEGLVYNSLVFVDKGEVKALATKRNLGRFDTNFSMGNGIETLTYQDKKIAFGFVEDVENFFRRKVNVEVLILCSNRLFNKEDKEELITSLSLYARSMNTKIIYVNRTGAEGSYIFNGTSFVMNAKGEVCQRLDIFQEGQMFLELDNLKVERHNPMCQEQKILMATTIGLRDYFKKNHINKAVIGLSGGIDSAVVAALGVMALGKENVTGILMPSHFSSDHSVKDAEQLAKNLGINYLTLPVEDIFTASLKTMQPVFEGTEPNTAEENLQARARLMIIMAFANKKGAAMLNTSNKSESAVGYGTLYGDDSGAIAAIGDLYKTEVYQLARWINRKQEIIPQNTIDKAPSAELRFDQKDSDSLPEYDILDKLLIDFIDNHKSRTELLAMGYDEKMVDKVLRLFKTNEWKRHQEAPALRLSRTCFTTDFFNPIS